MNWLMRILGIRHDKPVVEPKVEAAADRRLNGVEARWEQQKQRVDPVLDEVERVQKLMLEKGPRNARPH